MNESSILIDHKVDDCDRRNTPMLTDPDQESEDNNKDAVSIYNDHDVFMDKGSCSGNGNGNGNDNSNDNSYSIEKDGNLGYHDVTRSIIDDSNSNDCNTNSSDDDWKDLRQLLSDFHDHVDVQLPTLLEDALDGCRDGHDGTSRRHFDLRRCFRNMQEILLRDDLLVLLDGGEWMNDEHSHVKNNRNNDTINSKSDDEDSVPRLVEIFANDLVQLSTISVFDDEPGSNHDNGIGDFGVQELHRSLVVLAADRFPVTATLDDDQISQLLSRVLSLIFGQQYKHRVDGFTSHSQNRESLNEFEPLQSLLSWLNREAAIERLSGGVIRNREEAASALRIPLEFFDEMAMKSSRFSPSPVYNPYALLPPQFVMSLRVLIDLLLGALDALAVANKEDGGGNRRADGNGVFSCTSRASTLRGWMSASERREHRYLLKLLDRFALELVEETLELLRPQRKPPPVEVIGGIQVCQRHGERKEPAVGEKRGRNDYNDHDVDDPSPKRMTDSSPQRDRVVRVLQHAAITTNFFTIMEADATFLDENKGGTNGTTSAVVGLSRCFWKALARFVVEEVDCLCSNDDNTIHFWENYQKGDGEADSGQDDVEECQIAATDMLLRLTKVHTRAMLFQHKNLDAPKDCNGDNEEPIDDRRARNTTTIPPARSGLCEEEFSIVATTILRLLGHPEEFWTAETQSWVADLLRMRGDQIDRKHPAAFPASPRGTTPALIDFGSRLRRVLQAAYLCTTYVPDTSPFEEQHRVNLSIKELLRASSSRVSKAPDETRNFTGYPSVGSKGDDAAARNEVAEDPWETFWSVRQGC